MHHFSNTKTKLSNIKNLDLHSNGKLGQSHIFREQIPIEKIYSESYEPDAIEKDDELEKLTSALIHNRINFLGIAPTTQRNESANF